MGSNVKKIVGAIYLKNGRAMNGFGSDSVCDFDAVREAERLSNSNADGKEQSFPVSCGQRPAKPPKRRSCR